MAITYKRDLAGVDWAAMKRILQDDDFDNGRTPEQLATSFANSASTCIAYDGDEIIGTVRALSDGVCNAYIVDVWTWSQRRKQGIAHAMIEQVLRDLPGQHVYLWSDDAADFYRRIGFRDRPEGLELVVGRWLDPTPLADDERITTP